MRTLRTSLLAALAGCLIFAASADPTAVIVEQGEQAAHSNISAQSTSGAYCVSPVIGHCGSCSISCPTGKSAMCKPGIAVNQQQSASCLTAPECKCQ